MTSFYFYDLETSGVNPKTARVMQFAGQRTDMNLQPIGEPHNVLIKLSEDVLPEPDAILVTGITPQKTIAEGISEPEFLQLFHSEIATGGTIFTGFNSVRFDDEFMRYMQYRNFYDPYEWQWRDGRSRWDLLDVVRMTRALRPEGITWPFDSSGAPTNRLELLTDINNLQHTHAHDALSDVFATIELAKLVKEKQPKLFSYLLEIRDKNKAKALVDMSDMFVYSSGKYASEQQKTTIATKIADTKEGAALVYDLTLNPKPYLKMSEADIIKEWQKPWNDPTPKFPVKTLKYNRCPALAPITVFDKESQARLGISMKEVGEHYSLLSGSELGLRCQRALERMNATRNVQQKDLLGGTQIVDTMLYDGFISNSDKRPMQAVREADRATLSEIQPTIFNDKRLKDMLPLYKARNYPELLSTSERLLWEAHLQTVLAATKNSQLERFMRRMHQLAESVDDPNKRYLLEELQLYAESILPESS